MIKILLTFGILISFTTSGICQENEKYDSNTVVAYKGLYETEIKNLLSKAKDWKTPSSLTSNDGVIPKIVITTTRDNHVNTALSLAWAAESYFKLGDMAKSIDFANKVKNELQKADNICTDGQEFNSSSQGLSIYPCPDLKLSQKSNEKFGRVNNSRLISFDKENVSTQVIEYFFSAFPGYNNNLIVLQINEDEKKRAPKFYKQYGFSRHDVVYAALTLDTVKLAEYLKKIDNVNYYAIGYQFTLLDLAVIFQNHELIYFLSNFKNIRYDMGGGMNGKGVTLVDGKEYYLSLPMSLAVISGDLEILNFLKSNRKKIWNTICAVPSKNCTLCFGNNLRPVDIALMYNQTKIVEMLKKD